MVPNCAKHHSDKSIEVNLLEYPWYLLHKENKPGNENHTLVYYGTVISK